MKVELILGDCLEKMKDIPDRSIDLVLADPPYGNIAQSWDSIIPFEPMWKELLRVVKERGTICLFGTEPFSSSLRLSNIEHFKYDWIWQKTLPSGFLNAKNKPLKEHEIISVFSLGTTANGSKRKMFYYPQMKEGYKPYKKKQVNDPRVGYVAAGNRTPYLDTFSESKKGERYPTTILKYSNNNHGSKHPTQKPVELLEYIIRTYTLEGETVLDFVFGSGSTGIACVNTNRNFIGIELDEIYFNIAKERIEKAQAEVKPLF
jgi:DNA modification methylase